MMTENFVFIFSTDICKKKTRKNKQTINSKMTAQCQLKINAFLLNFSQYLISSKRYFCTNFIIFFQCSLNKA